MPRPLRYSPIGSMGRRNLPCSTVNAQTVNWIGARSRSRISASSMVSESLPPESATATRSPSRIILKRATASPTLRRSVFSRSKSYYGVRLLGPIPQPDYSRLTLLPQHAHGPCRQRQQASLGDAQADPARSEHTRKVTMAEQRHVAFGTLHSRDDTVRARGDLFRGLSAWHCTGPNRPARRCFLNLRCG